MRITPLTAAAVALAVSLPVLVLRHAAPPVSMSWQRVPAIVPGEAGSVEAARAGPWFAAAALPPAEGVAEPGGVPEVVGIVGRLPDAAVVLVRRADGGSRALAVGQEDGGWRLESIAADAVLFVRAGQRARVELPAG